MKGELERGEGSGLWEMWGRADGEGGRWDGRTSSVEDDDDDDEEEKEGDAFKVKDKVRPAPLVLTLTDEQAALVTPESNQLLHLQLRKRYYAQALNFMRMVEGAMCVFLSSFLFFFLLSPSPSLLSFGENCC